MNLEEIGARVSAARADTLARGETFYPGASRVHLAAFPPRERWDDWTYLDSRRAVRSQWTICGYRTGPVKSLRYSQGAGRRELFARRRGVGSPQTTLPTVDVR